MKQKLQISLLAYSAIVFISIGQVEVIELQDKHLTEVKTVMATVCHEAFELGESPESFEKELDEMGEFNDLNGAQQVYFGNRGAFLLLIDNNKVFGMGGVKKLTNEVCELKKMWILKEYRQQGYGNLLGSRLESFARKQGYKKARLEFWFPEKQSRVIEVAKAQGFYEIEPYCKSEAKIYMEKSLDT